jgi:hypothetical protein
VDFIDKAARPKAKKNLESVPEKGNSQQPLSFVSRDDSSLIASTKSLGVLLGSNVHSVFDALKSLKDLEFSRLADSTSFREDNPVLVEDVASVCSTDDSVDLEALNLICSDVIEGLGDGGCDPLILQTLVSQSSRGHPKRNKSKIKKKSKSR